MRAQASYQSQSPVDRRLVVAMTIGWALAAAVALAQLSAFGSGPLVVGALLIAALCLWHAVVPTRPFHQRAGLPLAAGTALALAAFTSGIVSGLPLRALSTGHIALSSAFLLTALALLSLLLGRRAESVCVSAVSGTLAGTLAFAVSSAQLADLALFRLRALPAVACAACGLLILADGAIVLAAVRLDRAAQRSPFRWAPWAACGTGLVLTALATGVLAAWQRDVLAQQTRTEAIAAANHVAAILDNRLPHLAPERVFQTGIDDQAVPGLLWYGQWTASGPQALFVAENWQRAEVPAAVVAPFPRVAPETPSPVLLRRTAPDGSPVLVIVWHRQDPPVVAVIAPATFFAPAIQAAVSRGTAVTVFLNGEAIVAAGEADSRAPTSVALIASKHVGFGQLRAAAQLGPVRAQVLLTPFPYLLALLGMLFTASLTVASILGWREVVTSNQLRALNQQLIEEIDERKTIERLLAEREARWQAMLRQLPAIVWTVDRELVFTSSEGSGLEQLGLRPGQVVGQTLFENFGTDDPDYPPIRLHRLALTGVPQEYEFETNGRHYRVRLEPLRTGSGDVEGVIGIAFDVTEHVRTQQELVRLATTDALTGLANRPTVLARIEELLRARQPFAVLLLDLDGFKTVNDSLGHLAGDALLREVARRLRQNVRSEDTVGRLGGDEFLVVAPLSQREGARELASRLLVALSQPFRLEERTVTLGASIGIVLVGDDESCSPTDILQRADLALYEAKRRGKGRIVVYDRELAEVNDQELLLMEAFRDAVGRGALAFTGLPIVHLRSGELAGFEVRPSWSAANGTERSGSDLVALAERTGLDLQLARATLAEAAAWLVQLPEPLFVVVGFPSRSLLDPDTWEGQFSEGSLLATQQQRLWLDVPMAALERAGLHHGGTERATRQVGILVRDPVLAPSSIGALHRFARAGLRIPGTFVQSFLVAPESAALARALVQVARELSLRSLAEGIDELATMVALARAGCQHGQGPLFGPPRDRDQALSLAGTVRHWGELAKATHRTVDMQDGAVVHGDERNA